MKCIWSNSLEHLVWTQAGQKAILDSVLNNETGLISNLIVKYPLGNCDHSMIALHIQFETRVFDLNIGNYEVMKGELAKVDREIRL